MTRRDDHIQDDHFQSAHSEKKEWVTPKISPLMGAVDTHGKFNSPKEANITTPFTGAVGPS